MGRGLVADQPFTGQRIRVLTIVDIFSKLGPPISMRFNYKGHDAVKT